MYHFTVLCLFVFMQRMSAGEVGVYDIQEKYTDDISYLVYFEGHVQESVRDSECSGSILTERWIISAAHCFKETFSRAKVIQKHALFFPKTIAEVNGSSIILHPDFHADKVFNEHDLALLSTVEDILFDFFTKPITLGGRIPKVGQEAIAAGYGYSAFGPWMPLIAIVEFTQCIKNDTNVFCTHRDLHNEKANGGVLVADYGLLGIRSDGFCKISVSHSFNCENRYVNIIQHYNWIQDILSN